MEKLCGIYIRVSTGRQAAVVDGSLDTQEDRIRNYINYRNSSLDFGNISGKRSSRRGKRKSGSESALWKIVNVYREEGRSGKSTDRPALQNLLHDVRSGRINTVICTKLDRITRSLVDFYKLNDIFTRHNVDFISLAESFDTSTPMGKAMLKMTLVWAELEREQTAARTREKMAWRAEQGLWNGSHILGYDLIGKKLVVNEKEAALVNLLFNKYLELGSILQVAEYLNKHGYRTKEYHSKRTNRKRGGGKFSNTTVVNKLTNRVYIGQIEYDGEIYDGQHQAIVDTALWNEANRKLKLHAPRRVNPKRITKHTFLLQGLLKCGWCGSYMSTKYCTGRSKTHFYYQCTKNAHGGKSACEMKYVPASELERVVLQKLKEMSTDDKLLKRIVKEANKEVESILEDLKRQRFCQENRLKPVEVDIKNLLRAIAKEEKLKDMQSVIDELKSLEQQKMQIERDIQEVEFEFQRTEQQVLNAQAMHQSLEQFSQIIDAATPLELKELVPRFVNHVTWTPTEIEIAVYDQDIATMRPRQSESSNAVGALELSDLLPGLDSNQRPSG